MYFFGIFFQLAINFFFQPKCTKRTKHKAQCIRFPNLRPFLYKFQKLKKKEKNGPINFFGGIIKNRYPRQIIIYSLFFEEGKEYTVH